MPTQNVNLSDMQAKFIRKSIHAGQYRNASEVVRAGLRLLEQKKHEDALKLKLLKRLSDGAFEEIDGGEFEAVDSGNLDQFVTSIGPRVKSRKK